MGVPIIGSFSNDDGDGNENVKKKKATGLLRKTISKTMSLNAFCTFLCRFFSAQLRRENA